MTPLQKLAMGLVVVLVDAPFGGYDGVPDVLGWVLVLLGLRDLRHVLPGVGTLAGLAGLAAVVSVALFPPAVAGSLPPSTGWLLSLPHLVFSAVLCGAVPALLPEDRATAGRRLRALRWVFLVLAAGPVLLYGGGVDVLLVPLAVVTVAANVYLVYLLFALSRAALPVAAR